MNKETIRDMVKNATGSDEMEVIIIENFNLPQVMTDFMSHFITFTKEELQIQSPTILVHLLTFTDKVKHGIPTTAAYNPHDDSIFVLAENRMFLDVARSIAHEMVHLRQNERGELIGDIPDIGGKIEDEANSLAGVVVKKFIYANSERQELYAFFY